MTHGDITFTLTVDDDVELRLWEESYAEELFALVDRNRSHLREWLPWLDITRSVEDQRGFIRRVRKNFVNRISLETGIWVDGRLTGTIGFHTANLEKRSTQIGYWISADAQGQGLITRCCTALLDYAFDKGDFDKVEIHVARENRKSRAIPERLGFEEERIEEKTEWLYYRFVDHVVYEMTADKWLGRRDAERSQS